MKLVIWLFSCFMIFTVSVANAATEQALVCKSCSYQQAKNLALSNALPILNCQGATLESHICFSLPRKIIVVDASSRQVFPFEVYHAKQGVNLREIRSSIDANDSTVHPEVIHLLNTGVDMHNELMDSFEQIAQQLIILQQLSTFKTVKNDLYVMAKNSCENDADAQVILDAFDIQAIGTFQRQAQITQREQTDGIIDRFMSYFDRNTASLDSAGFELSKSGFTVSGTVILSPKKTSFSAIYNSDRSISYVMGHGVNAKGMPTLVYDIKTNVEGDLVVQVNKSNSYLSSNVPLSTLVNNSGDNVFSPVSVSSCAADAIASVLPNTHFSMENSGGVGENLPPDFSGVSPGGSSSCSVIRYGKVDGKVVLILKIKIC